MDFFAYQNVEFYNVKIKFYGCIITKDKSDFKTGEQYKCFILQIPTSTLHVAIFNQTYNTWYTKIYKINEDGNITLIRTE